MIKRSPILALLLAVSFQSHAEPAPAAQRQAVQNADTPLKIADVFSDHMVLQRDRAVPVWGTANAGSVITIEFSEQKKTVIADASGKWRANLDSMPASAESRMLQIASAGRPSRITLRDVLVGDVWLCSGQSNMTIPVRECADPEREIAAADHPLIRFFSLPQNPSLTPVADIKSAWMVCSPQTAAGLGGVAYFFGRELSRTLAVPVGLINSSVGATRAEAWTRLAALETLPEEGETARKEIAQWQSQADDNVKFLAACAAWEHKYGVARPDNAGVGQGWADPAHETGDWQPVTLARSWAQLGYKTGGVFWVRKEVELPEAVAGKPFRLSLLWLSEQYDTVYFNGVEIAHGGDAPPEFYMAQRNYQVPGKLVRAGRNVIAVRIVSASEKNGFWTWGRSLGLPGVDPLSVDERWLLKQEVAFPALPPEALASRPKPNAIIARGVSTVLYNGMIAPLLFFAIKGAIWYQGESNAGRAASYPGLLSLMIRDWRSQWGQGDFPFIIQQLVNFDLPTKDPNQRTNWPFLREAQMRVSDSVTNCGIAVGIELGEALTVHPKNKQDVGKRLALVALERTYGCGIESSGPRYESMKVEGGAIRVTFTHADGLMSKGGPPKNFSVAGPDMKFVWADAKIEGASVKVSSPQIPQPVAVRYAWADNPEGCALYNKAGLPAAPFRTDNWK